MRSSLADHLVRRARAFAAVKHAGQIRKGDGQTFMVHPVGVSRLLAGSGMSDSVVAAGLLHDVLEDTDATAAQLRSRFGSEVAGLVQEVTEPDKSHPWEFRKKAYLTHLKRASRGALAISCADKIHNVRSLVEGYEREGRIVFSRFSRGIEQNLDYYTKVYQAIRAAWSACPLLPELKATLERLSRILSRQAKAPPKEVEAKFWIRDPKVMAQLTKLKTLGPFKFERSVKEHQRNIYWDTPDLKLKRKGAALKLRQVGKRWELTFKAQGKYQDGVWERVEVSRILGQVALKRFKQGKLDMEPVRRAQALIGRACLEPVLELITDRGRGFFRREDQLIELDLDRVKFMMGKNPVATHFEAELENLSATGKNFRSALTDLKTKFGKRLKLTGVSKYELGLKLTRRPEPGGRTLSSWCRPGSS